jgi:hypothetical protein
MVFEDLILHQHCSENLRSSTDSTGTNVLNSICTRNWWPVLCIVRKMNFIMWFFIHCIDCCALSFLHSTLWNKHLLHMLVQLHSKNILPVLLCGPSKWGGNKPWLYMYIEHDRVPATRMKLFTNVSPQNISIAWQYIGCFRLFRSCQWTWTVASRLSTLSRACSSHTNRLCSSIWCHNNYSPSTRNYHSWCLPSVQG